MGIRPIMSSCTIALLNPYPNLLTSGYNHAHVKNLELLSYLKDMTQFLKLIETTKLPQNCILASIDVSSLLVLTYHMKPSCSWSLTLFYV